MQFVEYEDNALATLAQSGDLSAYDELVRRYQQKIAQSLFRFYKNDFPSLQDAVQDVFIQAYHKLSQWDPKRGNFGSWLYQLAYRKSLDNLRKSKRNPLSRWLRREAEAENSALENLVEEPRRIENPTEASDFVEQLLAKLKPEERVAITLFYFENRSVNEIAETLAWSVSKTKIIAHRARKKLKTTLENYGYHSSQEIF